MSEIQKIVTAAEMQAIEQRWFDSGEIRSDQLIDRVGKAVANWILDDLATLASDTRILVLVGKGNNGSDALVASTIPGRGRIKRYRRIGNGTS